MRTMMKPWARYLIAVTLLGIGINLIYLVLPLSIMVVIDRVLYSYSQATLATLLAIILLSLLTLTLVDHIRRKILAQLGNKLSGRVTPIALETSFTGNLTSSNQSASWIIEDLENVRQGLASGHVFVLIDAPWILLYLAFLFIIHPLAGAMGLAGTLLVTLCLILLYFLEKDRLNIASGAEHSNNTFIHASLQHADVIAANGMLANIQSRYMSLYHKVMTLRLEAEAFELRIGSLIRFLTLATLTAVFAAGAYGFFQNQISTGEIFALILIIVRLFSPFEHGLSQLRSNIGIWASIKRLIYYIHLNKQTNAQPLPSLQGKITGESLSLAFQGRAILRNISFSVEPGEKLGILGPSSVGKSSLCKVLLGIYPATAGKMRIDDAEINHWCPEELNPFIGYLPQEPVLFQASVAENISRLAQPDAEKVIAAAQMVGIHEMILKFPLGYETKIDQGGLNLSAGERQLISLARAFYDSPRIVVLDEPDAHLGDQGSQRLQQILQTLKQQNITTIVVSDRPKLLSLMDKLIVLRDGQAVLYGPTNDVLHQLVKQQTPQQIKA